MRRLCKKYLFLSLPVQAMCVWVLVRVHVCDVQLEKQWLNESLGRTETPEGELRSNQSRNGVYLNQNQMTRISLHWLRHDLQPSMNVSTYECLSLCPVSKILLFLDKIHSMCLFPQRNKGEKIVLHWFEFISKSKQPDLGHRTYHTLHITNSKFSWI